MNEHHAELPGLFGTLENETTGNADLYDKDPDQLRAELAAARAELEDTEKKRLQREREKYKRITIMANKDQWETVRRYCYTKNITQGRFVETAIDMYLDSLDIKRLKKIPPEGIHKGGRPRK